MASFSYRAVSAQGKSISGSIAAERIELASRELKSQGVRFKSDPVSITAGPNKGGLVAYFYDPDGHPLELFQPASGP